MNHDYEIKKIKHLNLVLRSFRDIGRLLITLDDEQQLIDEICNVLVTKRGYYNAWIGLLDSDQNLTKIAKAGFNDQFEKMHARLEAKKFTRCIQKTLESENVFCVDNPVDECPDCIFAREYEGRGSMAVGLVHEKDNYGFIVVSVPKELSHDETEKEIIKEIADDIAFGLYRLELEEERQVAERERQESNTRFKTLIENSLNCISIIQDNEIVYKNTGARKVHHLMSDAFEPPDFKGVCEDDRERIKQDYTRLVADEISWITTDFRYYPKGEQVDSDQVRWALISARKINYMDKDSVITNIMDITDSKEVENFLRIQDKMTSLGRVTAGIAHEIRNPLSGIYIYLKALKKIYHNMGDISQVLSIVDKVELASNKIESIIKRVMDFSKPGKPQFVVTDINKNIDEVTKLTSVSLRKKGIKFVKQLEPGIPKCWNEPQLIEQVVLNLITNAAEAMKNFNGEKIIELKTYRKDDAIAIEIRDTGPGIPVASQSKIFDPFYTTKTNSSGIGLSICHRIITDHGGALRFNANATTGACFVIELPLQQQGRN